MGCGASHQREERVETPTSKSGAKQSGQGERGRQLPFARACPAGDSQASNNLSAQDDPKMDEKQGGGGVMKRDPLSAESSSPSSPKARSNVLLESGLLQDEQDLPSVRSHAEALPESDVARGTSNPSFTTGSEAGQPKTSGKPARSAAPSPKSKTSEGIIKRFSAASISSDFRDTRKKNGTRTSGQEDRSRPPLLLDDGALTSSRRSSAVTITTPKTSPKNGRLIHEDLQSPKHSPKNAKRAILEEAESTKRSKEQTPSSDLEEGSQGKSSNGSAKRGQPRSCVSVALHRSFNGMTAAEHQSRIGGIGAVHPVSSNALNNSILAAEGAAAANRSRFPGNKPEVEEEPESRGPSKLPSPRESSTRSEYHLHDEQLFDQRLVIMASMGHKMQSEDLYRTGSLDRGADRLTRRTDWLPNAVKTNQAQPISAVSETYDNQFAKIAALRHQSLR